LDILRERVKPERDRNKREARRRYWWRFAETTPGLYKALHGRERCLVTSVHAKHLIFSFCPTNAVFSNALYVLDFEDYGSFGLLQSRIHAHWAWLHSSSLGSSGIRYSASRCLDTFPYPAAMSAIETIGRELYELRAHIMKTEDRSLTEIYNELEKPEVGAR